MGSNNTYSVSGVTNATIIQGDNNSVNTSEHIEKIDTIALADELLRLYSTMRSSSKTPIEDIAVADVARAEIESRKGDMSAAINHLKSAGTWALSCANNIGLSLASAVLKNTLGL